MDKSGAAQAADAPTGTIYTCPSSGAVGGVVTDRDCQQPTDKASMRKETRLLAGTMSAIEVSNGTKPDLAIVSRLHCVDFLLQLTDAQIHSFGYGSTFVPIAELPKQIDIVVSLDSKRSFLGV
jgi:hypothetical protein